MRPFFIFIRISFFLIMVSFLTVSGNAQGNGKEIKSEEVKFFWYSRVCEEAFLSGKNKIMLDEKKPQIIMNGISTLLTFEGDKKTATFCGATDVGYNSPEVNCTVEVAALFYASYIFYGKGWNYFATGIALVENGKKNDPKTIKKAFKCYREWFEKIKKIGIEKAREEKLDPLKGTGIVWY